MNQQSVSGRSQSVGLKLAVVPVIFIVAMCIIVGYVITAQFARRSDADSIDIAGRQRMLIQLYIKDLMRESLHEKNEYAYWRDTFLETQGILLNGGMALKRLNQQERFEVDPAPNLAIRNKLAEQGQLMQRIIEKEKSFLATDPSSKDYRKLLSEVNDLGEEVYIACRETVTLYTQESRHQIDLMIRNVIWIGIAVAALGLFLNWLLSRAISRPLIELTNRAQKVSQGDLTGEALVVRSRDEVGQLTESFNQMTQNLREIMEQNVDGIRSLSSSTSEILASTQQQSASTQEQVTALQQTTATMEEVKQSGAQISERARQVASEAEATSSVTEMGLKSVKDTVGIMDNIRFQVNEVAENIVNLSEKNRAVGDIIALVTEIAEQSNLLALNAAIEAAAAGEQGRSFSVVANEMKHLADQAKDSTRQVRGILEDIQKGIAKAVMLTEEAVKKVEGGRQQTEVADNTIRQMANTTQQSIQAFQQIVAATNQQQLGLEQVFQALQDIRQSTEQTAASTQQLTRASSSLNAMGQQLQQVVTRYRL